MVADDTGLVVKGDDPNMLFDAMRKLSSDGELRARMGAAAREYTEERSFENAFVRLWKLYEETDPLAPALAAKAG